MDTSDLNKISFIVIIIFICLFSCGDKELKKEDCRKYKSIPELRISFINYKLDEIQPFRIYHQDSIYDILSVTQSEFKYDNDLDSLCDYYFKRDISLEDTIKVELANGEIFKIYDFTYNEVPLYSAVSKIAYGCKFKELKVNGIFQNDGEAHINKVLQ